MGYKMNGFSGFGSSPVKQKKGEITKAAEKLKGTGNMELQLDRKISNRKVKRSPLDNPPK